MTELMSFVEAGWYPISVVFGGFILAILIAWLFLGDLWDWDGDEAG